MHRSICMGSELTQHHCEIKKQLTFSPCEIKPVLHLTRCILLASVSRSIDRSIDWSVVQLSCPSRHFHSTAPASFLLATSVRVHNLWQCIALSRSNWQRLTDLDEQVRHVCVLFCARLDKQRPNLFSVRSSLRRWHFTLFFKVTLVASNGNDDIVRTQLL